MLNQQAGAQRANAITAAVASRPPSDGNLRANGSKVKLPKLELRRFSGAATEWQPFWEQYQQAIHDNGALSDGEFLYLHSALSGRAAVAVAGIQATAANYHTVIELLKERFGRTDVLIQEHLTQMLDLPTVRSVHEVRDLRLLYDHMQRNIAALTTLVIQTDSYGAMLASALLRMLPGSDPLCGESLYTEEIHNKLGIASKFGGTTPLSSPMEDTKWLFLGGP
ncbi:hypothetical protein HPB51_018320 [Rhipicephalus microplus]|uniref:Tick transposon n=1 Tax=Rhipicephalus microplus TaxID=6941 RepID=A0A9J6DBB7_RHIMP|nr:hypothetical protein HPB51_018320 [Rhipicephalus microplus]